MGLSSTAAIEIEFLRQMAGAAGEMVLTSLALNTIPPPPTFRSPTGALNSLRELLLATVSNGCQGQYQSLVEVLGLVVANLTIHGLVANRVLSDTRSAGGVSQMSCSAFGEEVFRSLRVFEVFRSPLLRVSRCTPCSLEAHVFEPCSLEALQSESYSQIQVVAQIS